MGLLGDLYSTIDSKKRQLRGLLSDPLETLYQGVRNFGADQQGLLDTQARAYPWTGNRPQDRGNKQARKELADAGAAQGMAAATVWHSSPYKFDKFESGKSRTGEGAASFGHGTYLAESPEVSGVGGKYFEQFKRHPAAQEHGGPYAYKVDVPDEHVSKMLDWDKPISQQAPDVRVAITNLARSNPEVMDAIQKGGMGEMKGNILYATLQDLYTGNAKRAAVMAGEKAAKWGADDITRFATGNDEWASSQLHKAGIPGIRYLDQGSRDAGAGTSNLVVFPGNEDILKILERNSGLLGQ